ncbi:UNVERIFIED_CONTAM: hypothetical protein Sangu_0843000 [Sesamum angustifolium]|uniref:Uncharacterized protein n=1 Tax=Sesamum angustifolium TaxID=2727405 RepID=A0AAW2PWM2_9LAMI
MSLLRKSDARLLSSSFFNKEGASSKLSFSLYLHICRMGSTSTGGLFRSRRSKGSGGNFGLLAGVETGFAWCFPLGSLVYAELAG